MRNILPLRQQNSREIVLNSRNLPPNCATASTSKQNHRMAAFVHLQEAAMLHRAPSRIRYCHASSVLSSLVLCLVLHSLKYTLTLFHPRQTPYTIRRHPRGKEHPILLAEIFKQLCCYKSQISANTNVPRNLRICTILRLSILYSLQKYSKIVLSFSES